MLLLPHDVKSTVLDFLVHVQNCYRSTPDIQLYTIRRTKCRIYAVVPPDDEPGEARNM